MKGKWIVTFGVVAAALACYFQCGEKFNPDSINGKRVIVTGSSSGIGEQIAYHYAKLGARLVITARRLDLLENVAEKCRKLGSPQVDVVKADMKNIEHRDRLIDAAEKMGGLDILILNHVNPGSGPALFTDNTNMTLFRDMLNTNLVSYVDLASRLLPFLTESKGNIGVISAISGKIPLATLSVLTSNKFALQGFFSAIRHDLEIRGVDVSITLAVLGLIDTELSRRHLTKAKVSDFLMSLAPSAEDTALEVIKAVSMKKQELYYPRMAEFLVKFHKVFPQFLENLTPYLTKSSVTYS